MKLRHKIVALTTAVVIASASWAWSSGAAALNARGPSQPISEGTITYQRPEMVRPAPGDMPADALNGLTWVSQSDLTFHPLVPCRIVDTRAPLSHGRLPNNTIDSFNVVAGDYSSQGGTDGYCGVPNRALAVELNVVAANPAGVGYLKLYPTGATQPNASILNYAGGQTIANSATVGRCVMADGGLCGNDLTIYAYVATDIIIDVLGYYEAPLSAQVDVSGSVYGASLGLVQVEHYSPGAYGVHFYRDVETCVFTATPGWGDGLSTGAVFVEVDDIAGVDDGVYVYMRNSGGVPTDYPFQLVVHC